MRHAERFLLFGSCRAKEKGSYLLRLFNLSNQEVRRWRNLSGYIQIIAWDAWNPRFHWAEFMTTVPCPANLVYRTRIDRIRQKKLLKMPRGSALIRGPMHWHCRFWPGLPISLGGAKCDHFTADSPQPIGRGDVVSRPRGITFGFAPFGFSPHAATFGRARE